MRSLPPAALASTAALAVAACGGPGRYSLAATKECLAARPGVRLSAPPRADLVASTALGGAVQARLGRNSVVISFGRNEEETERLVSAYRRFRGRTIGIEDILRPRRNAVLLWRAHPSPEDEAAVTGCLK